MSVSGPLSAVGNRTRSYSTAPMSARTATFRDLDSGLTVQTVERNGRGWAAARGEIDLATVPAVGNALANCLAGSPCGLDLDLGDVRFFDCAGLNMLLRLRARALDQNVTLTISTLAPAVARMLDLTGTRGLFAAPEDAEPSPRIVRPAKWRSAWSGPDT